MVTTSCSFDEGADIGVLLWARTPADRCFRRPRSLREERGVLDFLKELEIFRVGPGPPPSI